MVFVVVSVQVFSLDGDFAEHLILLEMLVAVEHVYGEVAKSSGHLKLEFFSEKRTERKKNKLCYNFVGLFEDDKLFLAVLIQ